MYWSKNIYSHQTVVLSKDTIEFLASLLQLSFAIY